MMSKSTFNEADYQHWRPRVDDDHIVWLAFDKAGSSSNSLSKAVLEELGAILEAVAGMPDLAGLVIFSAKKAGFIAGADIKSLKHPVDHDDVLALIHLGGKVFNQLSELALPTIALIDGFCLGGGLELALACRYRIAEEGEKTKLGLPEVKIGVHPGWGGTVRLPRLIGAPAALNLILSGHTVSARAAARLGFVDAAVPKRQLENAARYYVTHRPPAHQAKWWQQLTNSAAVRPLLGFVVKRQLAQQANPEHYPAPFAALAQWQQYGVAGQKALDEEMASIARMFVTETAANLLRIFGLQDRLKAVAKGKKFKGQHIHVIGAGTMGGDIAAWSALQGYRVTLQDTAADRLAPAMKRAYGLYQKRLKRPHLIREAMDRLIPDIAGDGIAQADLIIEAIVEDENIKRQVFSEAEKKAKPEALFATNTSSIPLAELNSVLQTPERLVGLHFFNPVAKMPLVEVVSDAKTSPASTEQAAAFVGSISRLPLLVKSSPGFLVNRILMPYLMEALVLLQEGATPSQIDKAATDFGMPMGPVTLSDQVGLDVCLAVAEHLGQYYDEEVPALLREKVKAGECGVKSGVGFYRYRRGKALPMPALKKSAGGTSIAAQEITDRLLLRLLNEAVACLREGIIDDPDLLDAGMIFGTGFAPFRGGPIHYVKSALPDAVSKLEHYEKKCGERFKPDAGWRTILS